MEVACKGERVPIARTIRSRVLAVKAFDETHGAGLEHN